MAVDGAVEDKVLGRFQNNVCVLNGIACANQTYRAGHSDFKYLMRLKRDLDSIESPFEFMKRFRRISGPEFVRHKSLSNDENWNEGVKDIQYAWYVVHQRNIDCFELRPKREAAISDHERVRMSYTTD